MRKLFCLAACCILTAPLPAFGQDSSKDGWGPWRYTWQYPNFWSGILFRSKCISSLGGDSKWAYQFRSRYSHAMDFVEREEHGVDGAAINEFDRPEAFTLEGGALSPVFETLLHGTCETGRELRIEVIYVTQHDRYGEGNDPRLQDENGVPLEFRRIPDNPRYK